MDGQMPAHLDRNSENPRLSLTYNETMTNTTLFEKVEFDFDAFLEHEQSRSVLRKYVTEKSHCPEIILFLDDVEQYKGTPNKRRFKLPFFLRIRSNYKGNKAASKIVSSYIKQGSPKEVNISNEVRDSCQKKFQSMVFKVNLHLFDEPYNCVKIELRDDIFMRFEKSEMLKRYIQWMSSKTIERLSKQKLFYKGALSHDLERSAEGHITMKDVEFLCNLSADGSHWKTTKSKSDHASYRSRNKFTIGFSEDRQSGHFHKSIGLVSCTMNQLLYTIVDPQSSHVMDNNLYSIVPIEYNNMSSSCTLSNSITLETYPLAWPISNRDFSVSNTVLRTADGSIIYVRKSVKHEAAPQRRGTFRGTLFSAWILQKVQEKTTRYIYVFYRSMCDETNKLSSFFSAINKTKAKNTHPTLCQAVFNRRDEECVPKFNNGVISTLNDFDHKDCGSNKLQVEDNQLRLLQTYWDRVSAEPGEGPLKRITYISRLAVELNEQELRSIGEISVENNARLNVTGILLFSGTIFYQVIEGLPNDIDGLYEKIKLDKRHMAVKTCMEETGIHESERQFPIWNMRTVNLADQKDHFFANQLNSMISTLGVTGLETDINSVDSYDMVDKIIRHEDKNTDDTFEVWSECDDEILHGVTHEQDEN
ncbi:photoactivated adenylate cyclase subunit alpha [Acrasis kona]|uniref:Photoactivated adenylate cyclase subunit alpha n=1 Tax=Acrasis kona TaxID=1008807 RepID=A0AAW2Z938_9EUKA